MNVQITIDIVFNAEATKLLNGRNVVVPDPPQGPSIPLPHTGDFLIAKVGGERQSFPVVRREFTYVSPQSMRVTLVLGGHESA